MLQQNMNFLIVKQLVGLFIKSDSNLKADRSLCFPFSTLFSFNTFHHHFSLKVLPCPTERKSPSKALKSSDPSRLASTEDLLQLARKPQSTTRQPVVIILAKSPIQMIPFPSIVVACTSLSMAAACTTLCLYALCALPTRKWHFVCGGFVFK